MSIRKEILSFRSEKPFFSFPDIPDAGGFSFEKLVSNNFEALHKLFKDDDNPFTDARFKEYASAKKYAEFMQEWGAYMPKHGGQDWYFKVEDEYIGILHLYDLNLETFASNNTKAWIGFAITPAWRNKGVMKKVLPIFIKYVFDNYQQLNYLYSMTVPDNKASFNTLLSAGFTEDNTLLITDKYKSFIMQRSRAVCADT